MTPRRAVVELELISRIDQDGDCTETRTFARGELTRLRDSVTLAYREPDGDSRTRIRLSENGQALIHRTGEFSGRHPGLSRGMGRVSLSHSLRRPGTGL